MISLSITGPGPGPGNVGLTIQSDTYAGFVQELPTVLMVARGCDSLDEFADAMRELLDAELNGKAV